MGKERWKEGGKFRMNRRLWRIAQCCTYMPFPMRRHFRRLRAPFKTDALFFVLFYKKYLLYLAQKSRY